MSSLHVLITFTDWNNKIYIKLKYHFNY